MPSVSAVHIESASSHMTLATPNPNGRPPIKIENKKAKTVEIKFERRKPGKP